MSILIRPLEKKDFCVLSILKHLSNTIIFNKTDFENFIDHLPSNHHIFVLELEGKVIGIATIFIEAKLIHGFGKVAHIEDLIISTSYQSRGFGKKFLEYLVDFAKNEQCYKCILNCIPQNENFYRKCGFLTGQIQMNHYF
jgi:glucosamine-phosphate N-acetyltransferase